MGCIGLVEIDSVTQIMLGALGIRVIFIGLGGSSYSSSGFASSACGSTGLPVLGAGHGGDEWQLWKKRENDRRNKGGQRMG